MASFGLTDDEVVMTLADTLNADILDIFCHGIYTCVYVYAMWAIVSHSKSWTRSRVVHIAILSFMWAVATVRIGVLWSLDNEIFIVHGETRESTLEYDATYDSFHGYLVPISRTVNIFIADGVMIWRCWVIYGRSWLAILLPSACFIVEIITTVLYFLVLYSAAWDRDIPLSEAQWNFVQFGMTVATNSICTILIVVCILRTSGPSKRTYRGVIEILVESATLYALIYIVYIILAVISYYDTELNDSAWYAGAMLSSITGISPTLILARVALGKALPDDSWSQKSRGHSSRSGAVISALRFQSAPRGRVTTRTDESATDDIDVTLDSVGPPDNHEETQEKPKGDTIV